MAKKKSQSAKRRAAKKRAAKRRAAKTASPSFTWASGTSSIGISTTNPAYNITTSGNLSIGSTSITGGLYINQEKYVDAARMGMQNAHYTPTESEFEQWMPCPIHGKANGIVVETPKQKHVFCGECFVTTLQAFIPVLHSEDIPSDA